MSIQHYITGTGAEMALPPHREDHDWSSDGRTAVPGLRCGAVSQRAEDAGWSDTRCSKEAVVELQTTRSNLGLCGTHYLKHRRGAAVRTSRR